MGKVALDKETKDAVVQNANGQSFRTENTLSLSKKHRNSRIYLPILLNYYMDKVQTTLHPTDESNDVSMQISEWHWLHNMNIRIFNTDMSYVWKCLCAWTI